MHPAPLGSSGDKGVLKEGLVSVGSKQAEEPDPLDPEIIKVVTLFCMTVCVLILLFFFFSLTLSILFDHKQTAIG